MEKSPQRTVLFTNVLSDDVETKFNWRNFHGFATGAHPGSISPQKRNRRATGTKVHEHMTTNARGMRLQGSGGILGHPPGGPDPPGGAGHAPRVMRTNGHSHVHESYFLCTFAAGRDPATALDAARRTRRMPAVRAHELHARHPRCGSSRSRPAELAAHVVTPVSTQRGHPVRREAGGRGRRGAKQRRGGGCAPAEAARSCGQSPPSGGRLGGSAPTQTRAAGRSRRLEQPAAEHSTCVPYAMRCMQRTRSLRVKGCNSARS